MKIFVLISAEKSGISSSNFWWSPYCGSNCSRDDGAGTVVTELEKVVSLENQDRGTLREFGEHFEIRVILTKMYAFCSIFSDSKRFQP